MGSLVEPRSNRIAIPKLLQSYQPPSAGFGALGQLAQIIQHFPVCGTGIKFFRGSFCWGYGTGTEAWCKTTRDGQRYVRRTPPIPGGRIHAAHDIHGDRGDVLYAVEDGVIESRNTREDVDGGGFSTRLVGDSGRWYWYSHMERPGAYPVGAEVLAGDHLGTMGDTGNARGHGVHLHFQALEMIDGVLTPLDVYEELRAALVAIEGEAVASKIATDSGGPVSCTIAPSGGASESTTGGILLGLGLAAGVGWWLTRRRR